MSRVAYLSPLPPDASGIADYSAELLAGFGLRFEMDLFTGGEGLRAGAGSGFDARAYADFPGEHGRRPYDAVVYQLGNNGSYHGEIYRLLQAIPGIVVLHEYMLHDLMRYGGPEAFAATMAYSYGETGMRVARRMLALESSEGPWVYPLFERVVDASCGVIVHSESARRRVRQSRPGAVVDVVPLHLSLARLPRVDQASRRALRRALGVPEGALVLGAFGNINRAKHIDVVLRAFARFRREHPNSVFVLAGAVTPDAVAIEALLAGPLGEGVIATGRETLPRLLELMDLADVAINLRHPTGGETSAVCIRLLGLGTPVIVSAGGWFSEIPVGCCARVVPGPFEEAELVAVLGALAGSEALRRGMGAAAARWAQTYTLDVSVDGYTVVIERTVRARPSRHVDPLPPLGGRKGGGGLVPDVADAAVELGVPDTDTVLLPAVADALVELGLAGQRSRAR